jgi:2-C-methyl-D-erythritol 2,4-cyclodiphosphate synthase
MPRTWREIEMRIGNGFDVHAFAPGRSLVIGGVTVPHDRGLEGHSDADVLLHAIANAILGALALGDLGRHFPDSDARWKGVDSRRILREVAAMMSVQRYAVGNVDATVVAQAPRLAPYVDAMRANIALDLGCDVSQVSVKATTTERLGFAGREEGIAALATVLIEAMGNQSGA